MRVTDTHYFFFKHEFGQWTQRNMVDNHGLLYNCCEQYMMFQKAMLFGDKFIAEQIMNSDDPREQKNLGREVKGFCNKKWEQYRFGIVIQANYFKFTQHLDLRQRLLDTGEKCLVEASPYDSIWGVKLAADDNRILNPANWKGLNLLGKALMSVRYALRQEFGNGL